MLKMNLSQAFKIDTSRYVIEYRVHATRRMFQRNISEDDVERVLEAGIVIERYDNDFPLPSVLINGKASAGRPLHLVVGVNQLELRFVIITTYEPDPERWADNYTRRCS